MGGDYYMAVTVKQIAELANVSRGTVDRVLNNRSGVSGMAVFPLDHPNVYALLNSLIEKGIAVITFNSPAPEVKSLCFIGQ